MRRVSPAVLLAVVLVTGCERERIRVEMQASGGATTRTFASNSLNASDLDRLRSVYSAEPQADPELGKRFTASFASDLPSEVGNRNGLSEIHTRFGTTRFYYESFAPGGSLWNDVERRMQAGELWVRLFGRWGERQIGDASKREEWSAYVERDLVPLIDDVMLLWSSQMATIRFARVGQELRDAGDRSPLTSDEVFAQRVAMPLLLLLSDRGLVTPDEVQRLFLVSVEGNPSSAERSWAVEHVLMPALLRQVHRFRPNAKVLNGSELLSIGISFWFYATSSPDRTDLLLASPAISEEDKAKLRAGNNSVTLPAPFGIDPMRAPKRFETDVHLKTGVQPFATNGTWDEATSSVRFAASFTERARRTTLFPPIYFAAWAEPDETTQRRAFGEVLLEGADLASYAIWREALPLPLALRWEAALDELERTASVEPMAAFARDTREERPLPAMLAGWLVRQTGASPRG